MAELGAVSACACAMHARPQFSGLNNHAHHAMSAT